MTQLKAIVFDWGGVLIKNPSQTMFTHYAKTLGIDQEKLTQSLSESEHEFQTGKLTEEKLWKKICNLHSKPLPHFKHSIWGEGLKRSYQPKLDMFHLVKSLKTNGYKTALLSNTEPPMVPVFHEKHPDHALHFDTLIFSCIEGQRKPDTPIYELILQRLQTTPEETLFLNDKEENVMGAKKVGMYGHVFKSVNVLKKELSAFNIHL